MSIDFDEAAINGFLGDKRESIPTSPEIRATWDGSIPQFACTEVI